MTTRILNLTNRITSLRNENKTLDDNKEKLMSYFKHLFTEFYNINLILSKKKDDNGKSLNIISFKKYYQKHKFSFENFNMFKKKIKKKFGIRIWSSKKISNEEFEFLWHFVIEQLDNIPKNPVNILYNKFSDAKKIWVKNIDKQIILSNQLINYLRMSGKQATKSIIETIILKIKNCNKEKSYPDSFDFNELGMTRRKFLALTGSAAIGIVLLDPVFCQAFKLLGLSGSESSSGLANASMSKTNQILSYIKNSPKYNSVLKGPFIYSKRKDQCIIILGDRHKSPKPQENVVIDIYNHCQITDLMHEGIAVNAKLTQTNYELIALKNDKRFRHLGSEDAALYLFGLSIKIIYVNYCYLDCLNRIMHEYSELIPRHYRDYRNNILSSINTTLDYCMDVYDFPAKKSYNEVVQLIKYLDSIYADGFSITNEKLASYVHHMKNKLLSMNNEEVRIFNGQLAKIQVYKNFNRINLQGKLKKFVEAYPDTPKIMALMGQYHVNLVRNERSRFAVHVIKCYLDEKVSSHLILTIGAAHFDSLHQEFAKKKINHLFLKIEGKELENNF
jgi:hypothetical protein